MPALEKWLGDGVGEKDEVGSRLAGMIGAWNGAGPLSSRLLLCFSSGSCGRQGVPGNPAPTLIFSDSFTDGLGSLVGDGLLGLERRFKICCSDLHDTWAFTFL